MQVFRQRLSEIQLLSERVERIKVLILEGDPESQRVLSDAMLMDGYETVVCSSVREMRQADVENDVGLYVIATNLPDGDWLEVARTLRLQRDKGIVLVSNRDDEVDAVLGLELGADDYIVKPFRVRELRARIKSIIRRSRFASTGSQFDDSQRQGEYILQGLRINPNSRTVRSELGEQHYLTTLEFDLLFALTDPPNRILSRDEIMERLHGPNWAARDRNVDGLINRLRNKLFSEGLGRKRIKTIRGIGYMFCDDS